MDDFSQPRVQAHAAAAIVNFSESCEAVGHDPCHPALISPADLRTCAHDASTLRPSFC